MSIKIKNRNDIYNYRITGFGTAEQVATKPEAIDFEYFVNTPTINIVKFYDNVKHQYYVDCGVEGDKPLKTIVFGVGTDYEILAFEETATLEYKRIRREFEVALID